jgi:uncharacterized protein YaeQ
MQLGSHFGKVVLVPKPEEKMDHIAMKLAAFAMFLPHGPIVDPSSEHPALAGTDFRPDVCVLNDAGEVSIWIECGEVSVNKLGKLSRQFSQARFVVLKANEHQAKRLREMVREDVRNSDRIEIWYWKPGEFDTWYAALDEKTELFGESHEKSFNLVINSVAYAADLSTV